MSDELEAPGVGASRLPRKMRDALPGMSGELPQNQRDAMPGKVHGDPTDHDGSTPQPSRARSRGERPRKGALLQTAFAHYTLEAQRGQGGSSAVWSAFTADGACVAIKILDPASNRSRTQKRFLNEMSFCQMTKHDHIIRLLDHGLVQVGTVSSPFYVMELYPQTLRQVMDSQLAERDRLEFFRQVLDGMEYAHDHDIIHRDLKPENVLVAEAPLRAVVADFGIARLDEETRATAIETNRGDRLGNFLYAAPEQRRRGGIATTATDVFALGLILNELFTGEVPQGSSYRLIGAVAPTFGYLDRVVELMIRQDPNQRPQSARAVSQRLRDAEAETEGLARISLLERQAEEARTSAVVIHVPSARIARRDYVDGSLVFWFEREPDWAWKHALSKLHPLDNVEGRESRAWRVTLNFAALKVGEDFAAAAGRRFLSWLPKIDEHATTIRATMESEERAKSELSARAAADAERRRLEILRELEEPQA